VTAEPPPEPPMTEVVSELLDRLTERETRLEMAVEGAARELAKHQSELGLVRAAAGSLRALRGGTTQIRNGTALTNIELAQAYIATLPPGAEITLEDMVLFAERSGWDSPAKDRRNVMSSVRIRLANAGVIERRGRGRYYKRAEGHDGG